MTNRIIAQGNAHCAAKVVLYEDGVRMSILVVPIAIAASWPLFMKKFIAAVRIGRRGKGDISDVYVDARARKNPSAKPLTCCFRVC